MKKYLVISCFLFLGLGIIASCKKSFLDVKPKGTRNKFVLANDEGIDALLIGAYSMLDGVSAGVGGWESASSNWVFGSIRGMEANFGSSAGTQSDLVLIQNFSETPTHSFLDIKWKEIYEAVSRCNNVILVIDQGLTQGSIDKKKADLFRKQAKALRGWYHFEAWRMWKKIPYVDEDTNAVTVTNRFDVRSKIISDLEEGTDLPDNMGD
jgi:starch-binding outer membrane protein, SusD/RagB family